MTTTPIPKLVAPSNVSAAWATTTAGGVGTSLVMWTNNPITNAEYSRLDIFARNKQTPSIRYLLATISPVGRTEKATVVARNGWTGRINTDWEVMVRAGGAGQYAESSWVSLNRLVTPKPQIIGVRRISLTRAEVSFIVPSGGLAAPTTMQVSRTPKGVSQGASTQVNQTPLPASSIQAPIPDGVNDYDLRIQALGPAGPSGWVGPSAAPVWWQRPPSVVNAEAVRRASWPSMVEIAFDHEGEDGEAATSFLIERSDPGRDVWSALTTLQAGDEDHRTALSLVLGCDYRITAINRGGRSAPVKVSVDAWWQKPSGASNAAGGRTDEGQQKVVWSLEGATGRNRPTGWRIEVAPSAGGDFVKADELSADTREWVNPSSTITSTGRIKIVATNEMGDASTQPIVTFDSDLDAPNPPTGINATHDPANPNSIRVSFSPASSGGAAETVRLWVRDSDGQVTAATEKIAIDSVQGEFVHNLGPNRIRQYAVEAYNAAGSSKALTWTEPIATTPKGASRLTAVRVGTDVALQIVVDGEPSIATTWEFERSPDGGINRFPLALSVGQDLSAVHADASTAVEHTYWTRPVLADAPDAEWVLAVASVPSGARPLPPLLHEPGWGAVGELQPVRWDHQPVDGTEQAEAQLSWEMLSGSTAINSGTERIVGSTGEFLLPAPRAGTTLRWTVHSRGTGSATWSDPASWATRQIGVRPVLGLQVADLVESQTLTGRIIVQDGAWVSATVKLIDAGGKVISTRQLSPNTGVEFSFPVVDRQVGSVEAVVSDGRLESVAQRSPFTVVWRRPPHPTLTAIAEGDEVRLDVVSAAGLKIVRRRLDVGALQPWADTAVSNVGIQDMTLTGPDGEEVDATNVVHWNDIGSGGVEADVLAAADGETVLAFAILTSVGDPAPAGVPLWPETVEQELAVVDGKLRLWLHGRQQVALLHLVVIASRQADPDWTFFDGDSVREGFHYGWLSDGSAYEAVEASTMAEADPAFPAVARTELIRVVDGKSLGYAQAGSGRDRWPAFCTPETYIARNWGDNGSYSDSKPAEVTVHQRDLVINFGPDLAGRVTAGPRDLTLTGGVTEKELVVWETDSTTPRVEAFEGTTPTPEVATVTAKLWRDHSSFAEWKQAHNAGGPALLREPTGTVMLGTLVVGQRTPRHQLHREISITVTETGPRP